MRIAVSAMKQSGKALLPLLDDIIPFNNFFKTKLEEQKLICTMTAPAENHINTILKAGKNTVLLIGPEGDFHQDEINTATENGFLPTSLGPQRLRTETAAMTACACFNLKKYSE
jgi:16S rRNA (uracil1498-N3)-methyltransferase